MEFIKKNWVVLMVVAVIVAIIYYVRRQRKAESGYMITGCPPGLTPDPTTGICGNSWSWDQVPKGGYSPLNIVQPAESSYTKRPCPVAGCVRVLGVCVCAPQNPYPTTSKYTGEVNYKEKPKPKPKPVSRPMSGGLQNSTM